ncbi:ABC transporter permease [Bacillus sp. DTU_2020_1000418_1_SI_GHA_SEK_038]|nr:ABC transporter permease [Bacillus sp. DTU_2020_1000418_1_SI_GHA_SEK_038]WNS77665.1 ABC transporter permease [Bacillus sp. DTU_2020_1000418_1_SI_GHA_SEK_038]
MMIRRIKKSRMTVIGCIIIFVALFASLFSPVLTLFDPLEMNPVNRLQPPSKEHWFGTDTFGRDVFSRVIYGVRASMLVGFSVAIISGLIGTIVGLYASYYRTLDHILMRICDGLMAFPSVLLALALVAALGPQLMNVIIALSIVFFPSIARVVRSSAVVIREQTYIEALKSMGARSWRIIWLHIAPNTLSPLIVQITFIFAISLIIESMLSFLGAGIPAPNPSLGNILYDGKNVITKAWWMTVFPGSAIITLVLALNLFGDGLRDILDPHTKHFK